MGEWSIALLFLGGLTVCSCWNHPITFWTSPPDEVAQSQEPLDSNFSLWRREPEPFKDFSEADRWEGDGKISDLLRGFDFKNYTAETLRESILYQLSPGWTELDLQSLSKTQRDEHTALAEFFKKLHKAHGTISCVWDESLNSGKHTLLRKRIFLAANFKDNEAILPHLLVHLWHVIALLPEGQVYVSLYESSSKDTTAYWLDRFEEMLTQLKIPHRIKRDGAISYAGHNLHQRIELLSRVRNAALEPLWDGENLWTFEEPEQEGAPPATHSRRRQPRQKRRLERLPPTHIMFTNDVFSCGRDNIRLLFHEADMACGTDWWEKQGSLTFYDIWVARDISGVRLQWWPPYVSHPLSKERIRNGLHVPVKNCWNGLVVIKAAPFVGEGLRFRLARKDECFSSECKLICDDLVALGFDNIIMDPNVRMTYLLQDAPNAFKPQHVREIAITNWTEIQNSPVNSFDFEMSHETECCPLDRDDTVVNWDTCVQRPDRHK